MFKIFLQTIFAICAGILLASAANARYRVVLNSGGVLFTDIRPRQELVKSIEWTSEGQEQSVPSSDGLVGVLATVAKKYPVTLLTQSSCALCDKARTFLKKRGVPFQERIIRTLEDLELFEAIAGKGQPIPAILLGTNNILAGFLESDWALVLRSAGYPENAQLPQSYTYPIPTTLSQQDPNAPKKTTIVDAETDPQQTITEPVSIDIPPPPRIRF